MTKDDVIQVLSLIDEVKDDPVGRTFHQDQVTIVAGMMAVREGMTGMLAALATIAAEIHADHHPGGHTPFDDHPAHGLDPNATDDGD
jgi:hypothetical protein